MGLSIVCHECGQVLYDGRDMIQLYKLRREIDNKCPGCGRRLASEPVKVEFSFVE